MANSHKHSGSQQARQRTQRGRHLKLLHSVSHSALQPASSLWLAIFLPNMPLQAITTDKQASIVFTTQSGRSLIIAYNTVAESFGIQTNMTVSAALSLCESLVIYTQDLNAEFKLLNKVATVAYAFSDRVTLYAANIVALEISGSLTLFGGLTALQQALQKQLLALKLETQHCVAPTVRAASWLARYRKNTCITDSVTLRSTLRVLPVSLIADSSKISQQFHSCGINTLGDYLRLPRKDANRRFGVQALNYLQQALGESFEPLEYYKPPQPFKTEWCFDDPITQSETIEQVSNILLDKFQQYLKKRCAVTHRIILYLVHTDKTVSTITISCCYLQHGVKHFKTLLHERLHNQKLNQAVTSLYLQCNEAHQLPPDNMDLFANQRTDQQDWYQLLDTLQTRLGCKTIKQLSTQDDPRPEHAFQFVKRKKTSPSVHANWPLWLLEKPQRLNCDQTHNALHPLKNAERIEQGWWADEDIRRDYYRSQHSLGGQHWIFRDCRSKQWFLHGLFG